MTIEEFRNLCFSEFNYLTEDYNCHVETGSEVTTSLHVPGDGVLYVNATTGVSITLEQVERLPTVHLYRLHGPPNARNVFSLGLLLLVRAPELNPLKEETRLPLTKSVQTYLSSYAHALKAAADDILRGEFSVFPSLEDEWSRQVQLRSRQSKDFRYF